MLAALAFLNSSRTQLLAWLLQQRALSSRGLGGGWSGHRQRRQHQALPAVLPRCARAHLAPAPQGQEQDMPARSILTWPRTG